MDQAIKEAEFYYLFIQFYNNQCSANDLFRDSNDNPNGPGGRYNLAEWPGICQARPRRMRSCIVVSLDPRKGQVSADGYEGSSL